MRDPDPRGRGRPHPSHGDSEDIARAIPSHFVRFERFSNAGHGVFRDEPDRGLQILRDFITG